MADDNKIRDKQRFNEQCFLLDSWEKLSTFNKAETEKNPYENFIMVHGDPGMVVHKMIAVKGVEQLFKITPAQISLLVPKIKLYKIKYKDKNDKVGTAEPLVFNDHTSPKSIENITKNKSGRGDDVGLIEFSYELAGKNPAEGGLAKCKLVIFFNSAGTFIKEPASGGARFLDLIIPEIEFAKQKEVDGKAIHKSREWNPKHFRLKADVGWALPADPEKVLIDKNLRRAIGKSSTSLYLQLSDHSIEFDEKGTLKLEVTYIGAMEGALRSSKSDILAITTFGVEAEKNKKSLSDQRKKEAKPKKPGEKSSKKSLLSKAKGLLPKNAKDKDDKEAEISFDGKTKKREIKTLQALLNSSVDKQIRYSRIVERLRDEGRLYYTDVPKGAIEKFDEESQKILDRLREQGKVKAEDLKFLEDFKRQQLARTAKLEIHKISDKDKAKQSAIAKALGAATVANRVKTDVKVDIWSLFPGNVKSAILRKRTKEEISKIISAAQATAYTPKGEPDSRRVTFFFLGDLLDIVFSFLMDTDRDDNHNLQILLGPINFRDPLMPSKMGAINLGDIPISLNLFLAWYMKKVIAEQKEKYFVDQFIKDLASELIAPALGEDCFFGLGTQKADVSMTMFSTPGVGNGNDINPWATDEKNKRIDVKNLKNLTGTPMDSDQASKTAADKSHKSIFHFLYLYVSNWTPKELEGNLKEDLNKGVYHLFTGADKGLVKRIQFTKQDQPGVAEMRATQDSEDVSRIRGRYNAKIEMMGNNIFLPGMYIYIDTARMGMDKPTGENSIAHKLGIGGYYSVRAINHITNANNYETELDCQWISSGGKVDSWFTDETKSADYKIQKAVKRAGKLTNTILKGMTKNLDKEVKKHK